MKELDSEAAGGSEDSQQIQLSSMGRLVSNHLVCLPTKSEKMSCLAAKAQTQERVRPFKSCVPVSVERVDKDKDADENVDGDQISTGRPVSGQPTGLFTQLEEIRH